MHDSSMYILLSYCVVGYMLIGFVWFLVDLFLFDLSFKQACFTAVVWPYTVYRVKVGKRDIPRSFYSSIEFKESQKPPSDPNVTIKEADYPTE